MLDNYSGIDWLGLCILVKAQGFQIYINFEKQILRMKTLRLKLNFLKSMIKTCEAYRMQT